MVVTRPGAGLCGDAREGCPLGAGRARTRQLLVTMAGNHSKVEGPLTVVSLHLWTTCTLYLDELFSMCVQTMCVIFL